MSKDPVFWTTKNGVKINIDDMDENHLRNTLKMIIRKNMINNESFTIIPFSKNEINKIRHCSPEQENSEPYCDDWMWK